MRASMWFLTRNKDKRSTMDPGRMKVIKAAWGLYRLEETIREICLLQAQKRGGGLFSR